MQLPRLPPPSGRIALAALLLADSIHDPRARRAHTTAPSQPRANTALPLRRRLHLRALRQDDRRRTRLAHRESFTRRSTHYDAQNEEGLAGRHGSRRDTIKTHATRSATAQLALRHGSTDERTLDAQRAY